jgi:Transcription factor WhiB
MSTHTTVQVLGRPGWPTCTTKPGATRWSASLAGPAAPGGSGPGQCARARESRDEDLCRQTEKGDQGWLRSTPCIAACSRPTRLAMPRPWLRWRGRCTASWQPQPPIWARCGPGSGFMRPHRSQRQAAADTCEEPGPTPARRLRSRAARPHVEMSVQMRKLTAAASVSLGTVEPPAQEARPSGNGRRQVFAASSRLGWGASQPSPTDGPDEDHRCWPRQDNGYLPAAGLAALLPVASLGPDLPCTDDPGLFFAESPDDVETAKAVCRECPARAVCLAGALKRREPVDPRRSHRIRVAQRHPSAPITELPLALIPTATVPLFSPCTSRPCPRW